jgi:HAMP domain-containing protein
VVCSALAKGARRVFDGLRDRLERLRAALVEAKAGTDRLRHDFAVTERELAQERKQLEDAERRGRLAARVPDPETVAVAERFAARHRDRIALLERKLAVQRDELVLLEREVEEMRHELKGAGRAEPPTGSARSALGLDDDLLQMAEERRRMQDAVEAQLAQLKRKMGKTN